MRKILGIFLSLVLMFVFTSCGNEDVETKAEIETETVVETEEVKEEVVVEVDEPTEVVEAEETITVYAGSINQKYLIHMTIVQNGTDVIGSYYYDSRKINIPFTGEIKDGKLFITTDDGSETFDGSVTGNQINGTWTMGETVYDFDLVVESKIDASYDDHESLLEETIFEFNVVETGERAGIYVDNNEEYIVFRLAKEGEVIVEGPSFDETSWDYFEYCGYHRGGGAGNEGLDISSLTCTLDSVKYEITQEYSAFENITSYSFRVTEGDNAETTEYTIDESTIVGDLKAIENYDKIKRLQ